MPLVETQKLAKAYGRFQALSDCTLQINQGEVFGLLGPNGSGKTTLLRLLMGFLRPTSGSATIGGSDCYADSVAVHKQVSYLPGDVRLPRGWKGNDVLRFFSHLRNQPDWLRGLELARRLGLDLSRKVTAMSTGMRQKLALAAALAVDAPLLILDEPTSNLDPTVRSTVTALIREAQAAGRTIIFSSHVLSEVEQTCDRVVILRRGQVVHDQSLAEIGRRHCVRAKSTAALPPVPQQLVDQLKISQTADGQVIIEAPGDLSSVLPWLATLPLANVHIEPVGLQSIYNRYHSSELEPTPIDEAAA
ncbi:MAG TPA: ABC transporter ATP-binding protein [Pirellulales bacterium]|jgi:ABC-2 type transport system ATP-binding protein